MIYKSQLLSQVGFINHGFFGRKGGLSSSYFASLNVSYSSQDDENKVTKNRNIVEDKMGLLHNSLNFCYQIHSNKAQIITKNTKGNLPHCDSLVTKNKNLPLAIITADCAPLLFVDTKQKLIAATHAGWKGALNGIVENTLLKMKELGANENNISVCIGPCIGQESYEVSDDFYNNFIQSSINNKQFFIKSGNKKYLFSLAGYLLNKLKILNFKYIENLNLNTFTLKDDFFSHRRTTKNKEPYKGLQCCVINIKR